jgi:hypothetical protein
MMLSAYTLSIIVASAGRSMLQFSPLSQKRIVFENWQTEVSNSNLVAPTAFSPTIQPIPKFQYTNNKYQTISILQTFEINAGLLLSDYGVNIVKSKPRCAAYALISSTVEAGGNPKLTGLCVKSARGLGSQMTKSPCGILLISFLTASTPITWIFTRPSPETVLFPVIISCTVLSRLVPVIKV